MSDPILNLLTAMVEQGFYSCEGDVLDAYDKLTRVRDGRRVEYRTLPPGHTALVFGAAKPDPKVIINGVEGVKGDLDLREGLRVSGGWIYDVGPGNPLFVPDK